MKKAKALVVGNGAHKETDVGPLISREAKERAVRLITEGIHQARSSAAVLGTALLVLLSTLHKNFALLLLPCPLPCPLLLSLPVCQVQRNLQYFCFLPFAACPHASGYALFNNNSVNLL